MLRCLTLHFSILVVLSVLGAHDGFSPVALVSPSVRRVCTHMEHQKSNNIFFLKPRRASLVTTTLPLRLAEKENTQNSVSESADIKDVTTTARKSASSLDPMEEAMRLQEEKNRRADELRAQEVFIKRGTGRHQCTNCDYIYDAAEGDQNTIGGTIPPSTNFDDLPNNWRCPTCRASKDSFRELYTEIAGFEVNQGYGLGGNSLTSAQKSGLIFGGLAIFFLLFMSGYALS